MPHIITIENSESQRRQLAEKLKELDKKNWPLNGRYDAQNFGDWQDLFATVVTPGLFVQREAIVIENPETLGEFPSSLVKFIEDDNAECILILVFNSDTKNLKSVKDSIELIKPDPQIKSWERPKWLMSLAQEQKFRLDYDAAQLLANSISSQEELRAEIDKLAVYSEGRTVRLDDVQNISFDEGGSAQFRFLDGVCENNIFKVASTLHYLRRQASILPTLTAITNRLRPALMASCFSQKFYNDVLKTLETSNYANKQAQLALKNFGADKIKIFMAKAARLSFLEKTVRAESWQGFELIIWELMSNVK